MMVNVGTMAFPREQELRGRHVKWLIDGESFLRHLSDLETVRIVARCRRCQTAPTAVEREAGGIRVGCLCRHGHVDTSRTLELQPLLDALGWALHCADCGGAVTGDNATHASAFTVTCGCTTRTYRMAVA